MADRQMYFGTKNVMDWIPAPKINTSRGTVGYQKETQFTNAGLNIERSAAAPHIYELDWAVRGPEDLAHLLACYQGLYFSLAPEEPLIYFLDPFAMDTNVLPAHWASPMLAIGGAPSITDFSDQPAGSTTPANTLGYPVLGLHTTGWTTAGRPELWIPVPNGYTFHFGVHGADISGGTIELEPDDDVAVDATTLAVTSSTRTNYTYTPSGDSGITIRVGGAVEGDGMAVYGMIAQVLPNGQSVPDGRFLPGQGNSGCQFSGDLADTGLSAALGLNQYSATLKETGSWLQTSF